MEATLNKPTDGRQAFQRLKTHLHRRMIDAIDLSKAGLLNENDLRSQLRNGASDDVLTDWLLGVVWQKEARHHIGEPDFVAPPRSMSCIGG